MSTFLVVRSEAGDTVRSNEGGFTPRGLVPVHLESRNHTESPQRDIWFGKKGKCGSPLKEKSNNNGVTTGSFKGREGNKRKISCV